MLKKGEMTSAQIIALILAIVGFVIVIFLLVSLNFKSASSSQTCKLSVLTRATLPNAVNNLAPLKCTTQKYCLNEGGECDQFAGESDVQSVSLSGTTQQKAETVDQTVANAMYDCWSQMGEGKLDLFNGVENPGTISGTMATIFGPSAQTTCVICSRVAVGESVSDIDDVSKSVDVNNYMATHSVPGGNLTYLQTFTNPSINSYPSQFKEGFSSKSEINSKTNQMAIVFMQIKTPNGFWKGAEQGALGSAGLLIGGAGALGGAGFIAKTATSSIGFIISAAAVIGGAAYSSTTDYENQQLSIAKCGNLVGKADKAATGCSLVVPIDYNNIQKLNSLCGSIEGSP